MRGEDKEDKAAAWSTSRQDRSLILPSPPGDRQRDWGAAGRARPHREDKWPFLFKEGGTPAGYGAALDYAIAKGWLWKHESGT